MSAWQPYIDNNLVGAGFANAQIIGLDGSNWAASKGFSLKNGEEKALIGGFTNPANVVSTGVVLNGTKYYVLKSDPRSIYGAAASVVEKLADYLIDQGY
ncbi:hypothetical protein PPL_08338 [Heterostelium album PN500]|uniref:Profilin n=1 Tax=Heterostelium pallidum (strain ATCC 26659 / Pp 5 / PN500) TaxID=670386 RepID=D3BHX0_HETP5|nr:hypothetical protein PPL_08338 [Heterostelium album PN500]EFA78870.1 hypothetical protein PPL_08338 [Heterostelium album PN500]|eukprot:XP_020430994.1 hypothetical protein PPL_08338 [Heterostelium album PN500]